jgi:hypothetical protein
MALCHFCGRIDFRNGQAVRAHLKACEPYQQRAVNESLYRRWRSLLARPPAANISVGHEEPARISEPCVPHWKGCQSWSGHTEEPRQD